MSAYLIALNRRTFDRKQLEAYWEATGPTLEGSGAAPLSFYRPFTAMESTGTLDGVVLLEFPDLAGARAWYESEAYQEAKKLRDGAADTEVFIVDGGMAPPDERLAHLKDR